MGGLGRGCWSVEDPLALGKLIGNEEQWREDRKKFYWLNTVLGSLDKSTNRICTEIKSLDLSFNYHLFIHLPMYVSIFYLGHRQIYRKNIIQDWFISLWGLRNSVIFKLIAQKRQLCSSILSPKA